MKDKGQSPAPGKRLYRTPRLKVHGDLRKITAAKGGSNYDGSGKPRTRSFGGNS
jgi:hypothetical protein